MGAAILENGRIHDFITVHNDHCSIESLERASCFTYRITTAPLHITPQAVSRSHTQFNSGIVNLIFRNKGKYRVTHGSLYTARGGRWQRTGSEDRDTK